MVDNNTIESLMNLGLSEYEARIYLTLINNYPLTAYEIAKNSGVPTSKVYEALKKLFEKEIISVTVKKKTNLYTPINPDELINRYKNITENTLESLRIKLYNYKIIKGFFNVWNISDYNYFIDKSKKIINKSSKEVLISIWKEEFTLLEDTLKRTLEKGINLAIVHFGYTTFKLKNLYLHPTQETIHKSKHSRSITIVIDKNEMLTGIVLPNNKFEGVWTMNRGLVVMAEDYIKHDIYMIKILKIYDNLLRDSFGNRYEKLREIF